jgi:GDP/UDP-N,N'-diacetylbacillosamine 2-epimerase (hydrolysing)|tara:strand:+ start:1712 stop:2851 length:1140 start_codon:yes stop_codon:yes gene_type:complete
MKILKNSNKRQLKIGLLTSSRADYGIYKPLLKKISQVKAIDLTIIAFGMHLKKKYGQTINDINRDNLGNVNIIKGMSNKDSPLDIANSYGQLIKEFSSYWGNNKFDYVIALGDRFEMSAAVQSGIPFEVKFIHLHGGETTLGSVDNIYRHQITLASKIHFVATDHYLKKVSSITGSKKNIYNHGALSLDGINEMKLPDWPYVCQKFCIPHKNFVLVTFHPETIGLVKNKVYTNVVFESLKKISKDTNIVITLPNADAAGDLYRNSMIKLSKLYPKKISIVENFGRENYFSAMKHASMMIGNTSSGILESASFKKYVINVGDRQKGRLKNKNVFDIPFSEDNIIQKYNSIKKLTEYSGKNIFFKKNTAEKIIETIKKYDI